MIVLEKYTGFNKALVFEHPAQYSLSKKTPVRIDFISAVFTESQ